jgi:hypothetical protein
MKTPKALRTTLISLLVICVSPLASVAQDSKAKSNREPLSDEQIAVYRAVLDHYMKNNKSQLHVADKTEGLQELSLVDTDCATQFDLKKAKDLSVVYKLPANIAPNLKIVLVDPEQQRKQVEENDPQNLIKSGIDEHKPVTDEQIGDSVRAAFANGLFTLSEIVFDDKHQRALVAYSFVCGGLCGHGDTLILEKVGLKWKVKKVCGGWVS